MNNIRYKFEILLSVLLMFFSSCNNDSIISDENKSIVTFEKNELPVISEPGETLSFNVKIKSDCSIKYVVTILDSKELDNSLKEYSENVKNIEYAFEYKVKNEDVGHTLNFIVKVKDEYEKEHQTEYMVYVKSAKPNIDIIIPEDAPTEILEGETVDFTVEITSSIDLKVVNVFLEEKELEDLTVNEFEDPQNVQFNFEYKTNPSQSGMTLDFVFKAMDGNGNIVQKNYTLNVIREVELDISEYYGVKMGSQSNTQLGQCLNTKDGLVYKISDSKSFSQLIDIVNFYSNGTHTINLTSPSDTSIDAIYKGENSLTNWEQRNETKFKTTPLINVDFDKIITHDEIKSIYESVEMPEVIKQKITQENVVLFKNCNNKYGIIILKSFQGGSAGYIEVDLKIGK